MVVNSKQMLKSLIITMIFLDNYSELNSKI